MIEEDSSIIVRDDVRGQATTLAALSGSREPTSAAEESYFRRGRETRRDEYENSLASRASSPAGHTLEKRARYKTKSDRYDIVKHDDGRGKGKKKRSRAEPKKSKKKRDHIASAKEVMDNFSSNSILNDRITVCVTSITFLAELTRRGRCNRL